MSHADSHSGNLRDIEIILIDNFDSFTYNLVNQLKSLVKDVKVFRNNIPLALLIENGLDQTKKQVIVLSPGPGNPDGAGVTLELLRKYKGVLPILGICLGHQAIVQSYSGIVGAAKNIIHGKTCNVFLDENETQIFGQLASPFRAARYHSLAATTVPEELKIIATSDDDVMAVRHIEDKVLGFQFHPESILTPKGGQLLEQSLIWLSA